MIEDSLNEYVQAALDQPMVWGASDCTTWAAGWIELVHGRRVERPSWASRREAHLLIARAGSLAALWSDVLENFCIRERHGDPAPGDVGIITTHQAGPVGGIFMSHGTFAWRAEPSGVRVLLPRPKTIIKIWAVT